MAELIDGCAPAVILDLGPSGLEVCRALGRRGISVFGADRRLGIAARSRYCRASLAVDPRHCPEKEPIAVSYTHLTLPTTPYV